MHMSLVFVPLLDSLFAQQHSKPQRLPAQGPMLGKIKTGKLSFRHPR